MTWADEYAKGRAEQVKQQEIANLIAISAVPFLTIDERRDAAGRAFQLLRAQANNQQGDRSE